jgi:hypothetical protein
VESYKGAIHRAVVACNGVDCYTGLAVRWDLISTYDNALSKAGRRKYKSGLADLPSVDHVGDGLGMPEFRICAWRVNDAKTDLTHEEFVALCRLVVQHAERNVISRGTHKAQL